MPKTIPKQVVKGLKNIVTETAVETLKEPGRMVGMVKDGGQKGSTGPKPEAGFDPVLGKVANVNPELLEKYKSSDQDKSQKEVKEIRGKLGRPFRDVDSEMKKVRVEKDREEEEEEKFLEQVRRQREMEEMEGSDELVVPAGKKARGTAFLKGKKKAAGTGEMARKKN